MSLSVIGVIPAFNPPPKFSSFVHKLSNSGLFSELVVVDDGSASTDNFDELKHPGVLIRHEHNRGKGAAIKTAIQHIIDRPDIADTAWIVTVDADGQHDVASVEAVVSHIHKDHGLDMILGERLFAGDVPLRSKLGNIATQLMIKILFGGGISDTQTGLRAFSVEFGRQFLDIRSDRYEFEMEMLIRSIKSGKVGGIPISTIYEDGNAISNFRPLVDSMRIYWIIFRFAGVSLFVSTIDFIIFGLASLLGASIGWSQFAGRGVGTFVSFFLNRSLVFHSDFDDRKIWQFVKFVCLVAAFGIIANYLIVGLHNRTSLGVITCKAIVEGGLFILSFLVQKTLIFKVRK
ncbi:MAG: bifunctional glycosyltransferase family 2/GtrA family protein [Verrucomicrobiales bacterium]|nr:bifunctional glycosyltransferase family 2/GtrA family protein [Verrucomicrobiales bacterium]